MADEVFHHGERTVQARVAVRDMADRVGRSIRPALPPVGQAFLEDRTWLVLGALDADRRPWATILAGPRGFARAVDERTVRLASEPRPGDPLDAAIQPGAPVGLIAIDLATRRRLRVNGHVTARTPGAILIAADQAYSNCPKYIQRRDVSGPAPPALQAPPTPPLRATALTEEQRDRLRRADTFFIATAAPDAGVDASHRGGMPGFIHVDGQRLTWPDYSGNSLFNTLGNIEAWPHAGLAIPDFETGAMLLLTGRAAIDWDPAHAAAMPGAERLVTLDVEVVFDVHGALPERLQLREYSPLNPR